MDRLHLLKAAEWMTLWNEFRDGTLVKCTGDKQDDVVNHVTVPVCHTKPHMFTNFIQTIMTNQ